MNQLFTEEMLAKCQFKWQELAGKELLIQVGHYPDELGKGIHLTVVGMDKTTGECYVVHIGIEEHYKL